MAKHAHKLVLMNGKTWKCALPGCTFFVHLGLAHVLINRPAKCWKCENEFYAVEASLSTGKSICTNCNLATDDFGTTMVEIADARFALAKEKIQHINEVAKISTFQMKHSLSDAQIQYLKDMETTLSGAPLQSTRIEPTVHQSVNEHTSDCASVCFLGAECDCKNEVNYE